MSIAAPRQRLRTKTGCLTCRSRRKKCDEKTPVCERCSISGRSCQWPSSTDLVDRRYASHPRSRYSPDETILCLRSETTAHDLVTQDLEVFISRHFIDKYYRFLLLPNCHPDFYNGWINEIQELVVKDKSLHFSVLTNAASHIYNIDAVSGMQDLALGYYSKALRGLASMLEQPTESKLETHNGLLMSVMLLYLHGCMGQGTYADIPPHLNAAIRLLALRLFNAPLKISRPFDRLAVESVLYQAFLVGTGHWSDETQNQIFDLDFWLQAERLLAQSAMYPGRSTSVNSPVLGLPVPLYRLAVQVKQIYQNTSNPDLQTLSAIRTEIESWEAIVLCNRKMDELPDDEQPNREQEFYESASYLYTLVTSLLLEQTLACSITTELLLNEQPAGGPRVPRPAPHDCWQIQKAIQIVKKYENDDDWAGCYIGNWPVYTLGFFLEKQEHVDLIRNDLKRRWEFTSFMQIARFQHDLNKTWISRGQVTDSQAVWPDMDCLLLKPSD